MRWGRRGEESGVGGGRERGHQAVLVGAVVVMVVVVVKVRVVMVVRVRGVDMRGRGREMRQGGRGWVVVGVAWEHTDGEMGRGNGTRRRRGRKGERLQNHGVCLGRLLL